MKYSLRSLMIAALMLPPLLAGAVSWVNEMNRPRRHGCFGNDLGPLIPQRIIIQPEDETKLGLNPDESP